MISREQRISDILSIIDKLDISPSMHRNAVEKYKSLGEFLTSQGIEADFYPQGSFSIGTVIRPYKNNQDANYDLDAICQISYDKKTTSPEEIMKMVKETFQNSDQYSDKLEIYNTCCTIQYADVDGIGFSIDIVPAVEEDAQTLRELVSLSQHPEFVGTSIAITDMDEDEYKWATNNPKGYKAWFLKVNEPFLIRNPIRSRQALFESNITLFASIEEIPEGLMRSALQRVIQILKRHRDVFFSHIKDGDQLKPKSSIITTIVTLIAQNAPYDMSVFDLLRFVIGEFDVYSQKQILNEAQFSQKFGIRNVIQRHDGLWKLENPVNPKDNLANSWNTNPLFARAFFNWTKQVSDDFVQSLEKSDSEFFTKLESAFGSRTTRSIINSSKYSTAQQQNTFSQTTQSKPWGD